MKIKAIWMSTALATVAIAALTLGHQESALAKNDKNKDKGNGNVKEAPTPALVPGLIALGVAVPRKRKAQQAEVDA